MLSAPRSCFAKGKSSLGGCRRRVWMLQPLDRRGGVVRLDCGLQLDTRQKQAGEWATCRRFSEHWRLKSAPLGSSRRGSEDRVLSFYSSTLADLRCLEMALKVPSACACQCLLIGHYQT